jgi:multidrug resistance efflux pump
MLGFLGFSSIGGWLRAGLVLAVIGAVAGGYLYVSRLTATIADQAATIATRDASIRERDALVVEATRETIRAADAQARTAQALREAQADHAATLETLARVRATADQQRARLEKLKREIDLAPASDDGPLAPVLVNTFDALRAARAARLRGIQGPNNPASPTDHPNR